MRVLLCTALAFGLMTTPVLPGPFDDLTATDRAALDTEIRRYLLENPEIMLEVIQLLEDQQAEAAAQAEVAALETYRDQIFDDGVSFIGGNPEGSITIVEFIDYQCGFCKRAHPEVAELLERDGDIRLVQKEFPILGPSSEAAARLATAVLLNDGPEVYEALSDKLMEHEGQLTQGIMLALARQVGADEQAAAAAANGAAVTEIITANRALGRALNISGTPTFIIENEFVRGYLPLEQMLEKVGEKRAEM